MAHPLQEKRAEANTARHRDAGAAGSPEPQDTPWQRACMQTLALAIPCPPASAVQAGNAREWHRGGRGADATSCAALPAHLHQLQT